MKLSRRGFMAAAAAAPAAAKSMAGKYIAGAAQALSGAEAAANGAMLAGMSVAANSVSPGFYFNEAEGQKLLALHRLGLLPDWWIKDQLRNRPGSGAITPDVASLRSVPLSVKFKIDERRHVDRMMQEIEAGLAENIARATFFKQLHGGGPQ